MSDERFWEIVEFPARALNRRWWQFWKPRFVMARFGRRIVVPKNAGGYSTFTRLD